MLLFYGYATGVFSSRKLERATYDFVAFRYIAAIAEADSARIFSSKRGQLFVIIGFSAQHLVQLVKSTNR